MTIPQIRVLLLGFLVRLVRPTLGQIPSTFQWQFADSALCLLPTCSIIPIVVNPLDPANKVQGVPPYYMISFAVGGTVQTSLIGTDENDLSWTVAQPVGSQLALSVVDSTGSPGGVPPRLFQVALGQSTQCVVTQPAISNFTVTADVTSKLTTCQPWGLNVQGGVPPYQITFLQLSSPSVTNATIPNGLNNFTFINRATPGLSLIAAVSDFTGRWASGTPFVETEGPTDTSCTRLVSQSNNSTQAPRIPMLKQPAVKRNHSITIGLVVGLILLIFGGLGLFVFLYLRKRKREYEQDSAEAKPCQFVKILSDPSPSTQPATRKAVIMAENHGTRSNARTYLSSSQTTLLPNGTASRVGLPGFVAFLTTSMRRSVQLSTFQPAMPIPSPPPDFGASGDVEEPVFQHRDGGFMEELPPPYSLRRSRGSSS